MRILVVTPELPAQPFSGLGLQLAHLLRELVTRHEVTMIGLRAEGARGEPLDGCETIELDPPARTVPARLRTWLRASRHGVPFMVSATEPLNDAVAALTAARDFDVAHVASSRLGGVAPALRGTPAVLAALDAWHLNAAVNRRLAPPTLRPLYALEERRIQRFEAWALRPYRRVVVVSEEDGAALREFDSALAIDVIPNGVDTQAFAPGDGTSAEAGHLVFSGTMSWSPNVEAARFLAREILPRVRAARPDTRLSIVGRTPSAEVLALGEQEAVDVTGEVAEMPPWLWRAQVYACPMVSGTGIKNKLLEALACETAAVATPLACQGMEVRHERELLLAKGAEDFAAAILRLLDDPALRERLAAAARRYVVAHHGWRAVADAYERVYAEAARR